MTPTTLRALAARCCAGETTDELRDAVLIALGWKTDGQGFWRRVESLNWQRVPPPNPLTDLNASAAAMPAGLLVLVEQGTHFPWTVSAFKQRDRVGEPVWDVLVEEYAPTEPLARTAAALMARAAEEEQKEVEV